MKNVIYLFLMICIFSCNNKAGDAAIKEVSAQERFLNVFPMVKLTEEPLHFYNIEDDIEKSLADSIVENALSKPLLEKIGFQTGDTKYEAMMQFPLDENHIACVLNTNESWYKQQSLLVFDESKKEFENVFNLSQFYGGDGGQVVVESWLYKEGKENFLYMKESSHALVLTGTSDEPEEFLSGNAGLQKWNGNSFQAIEMQDSTALSKQFELSWKW